MEFLLASISLEYLKIHENLSVRAISACRSKRLQTLDEIYEYYQAYGTFCNIRNCGLNTEKELINIIQKYKDKEYSNFEVNYDRLNENGEFGEMVSTFSPFQKSILKKHLDYLLSMLSVRAKNGLSSINELRGTNNVLEILLLANFQFDTIKNIGKKTVDELASLKTAALDFIHKLVAIPINQLDKEYAKILLLTNFDDLLEEDASEILEENGKIKIFKLVDILLKRDKIFNNKEKTIFFTLYSNLLEQKTSMEDLSARLELTRERVRQIKKRLQNELPLYFSFVSTFSIGDIVNYGIDESEEFYIIDKALSRKINDFEDSNFDSSFQSVILGQLLENNYKAINNNEIILNSDKKSSFQTFKSCYLLSKKLLNSFRFYEFIEDLANKLSERIIETYELHFKGYIHLFVNENYKELLDSIYSLCELILFDEFELYVNADGYLIIEKNTRQYLHQCCQEILAESSQPMTVDNILRAVNIKYPDLQTTSDSIRGSLNREKEIFIFFGRSSTYGLRIWEQEKENLKGGTIRDIVAEYLIAYDEPRHLTDIAQYVLKFRATNEKSVLNNLKMDESKRFVFFKNLVIGLAGKHYKNQYSPVDRNIRTWDEKFSDLKEFRVKNNDRWPNVAAKDPGETSLYIFGLKCRRDFEKGKLSKYKENLLRGINYPIDEIKYRGYDWLTEFENLKRFFEENQRWPSSISNKSSERALKRFLYFNNKSFNSKTLDPEKETLWKTLNFPVERNLKQENTFLQNLKTLEEFIKAKNKLPIHNSQNKEERNLYRFLTKSLRLLKNNELDYDKILMLRDLKLNDYDE